ncbi:hypothetical protein KI387_001898, partial [Taxus chinensis]
EPASSRLLRPFVPNVPLLLGKNSSDSPDSAGSRTCGPDVPFASGLFVLILADPAGSHTSRTLVPNCPTQ